MGGSQKSKRVSWASDVNLCQVRLFLSEESPSQVGIGSQDHLQAKALWHVQSGGVGPDENLPPGFEGLQHANMWRVKLSQIPLLKWKCPARVEVNINWHVVAGEESVEADAQNQREMRVLEAIYPRPSAIPPNPSVLEGAVEPMYDDERTPVVPITPIEDEDAAFEGSFGSYVAASDSYTVPHPQHASHVTFPSQGSIPSQTNGVSGPGMEPDIVAAAQAALSSLMSNTDPMNLINPDLLMKILSDPKMIEQLVSNHVGSSNAQSVTASSMWNMPPSTSFHTTQIGVQTVASSNLQNMPSSTIRNLPSSIPQTRPAIGMNSGPSTSTQHNIPNLMPPKTSFHPANIPMNRRVQSSPHITRPELSAPPPLPSSTGPFYPPNRIGSSSNPNIIPSVPEVIPPPSVSSGAPLKKDINYYKSLIQQHGGEKRESLPQFSHQSSQPATTGQEYLNMGKPREQKPKIMKPCIYFNSSRGCRNGDNCVYQHDTTSKQRVSGMPEVQNAKRMKFDREIPGS